MLYIYSSNAFAYYKTESWIQHNIWNVIVDESETSGKLRWDFYRQLSGVFLRPSVLLNRSGRLKKGHTDRGACKELPE